MDVHYELGAGKEICFPENHVDVWNRLGKSDFLKPIKIELGMVRK